MNALIAKAKALVDKIDDVIDTTAPWFQALAPSEQANIQEVKNMADLVRREIDTLAGSVG